MNDANTRKEKRTPVTLKIKFKSATLDQFIELYRASTLGDPSSCGAIDTRPVRT